MVVDKNVNTTHGLDGLVDNLFAVLLWLQVNGKSIAFLAFLLDHLLGLLGVLLFLGQVGDEAVSTLHGKQDSDRATNPRVSARDDGLLALELAGGLVLLGTTFRSRQLVDFGQGVELGLEARNLLMLDIGLEACDT